MKSKKSQNGSVHLVIIVVLCIALIGALGFVCWQNFIQPKVVKVGVKEGSRPNDSAQTISQLELESIVTKELDFLNGKSSLGQITNQDKLQLASRLYAKAHPYAGGVYSRVIKASEIEDVLNSTSINSADLTHESIECLLVTEPAHNEYDYNADTKTYSNSDHLGHGAGGWVYAVYAKPVDFNNSNNQYSISYKYVFAVSKETGSSEEKVYGTYVDAKNNSNAIHTFVAEESENYNPVDLSKETNYFINNFDSFGSKLATYTYTFEKVDGKIRLVDFSVK